MSRLLVTLGDQVLVDRPDVHRVDCEQTAQGLLSLTAEYPPVKGDWVSTSFKDAILGDDPA